MRKLLVILYVLAWIPLCWQPLRGQAPSVGIDAPKKKPDNAARSASTPNQRGTKQNPLVVDTLGQAEEQYHRDIDRRTLIWNGTTAIATIALVLVGIGGIIAAICTLRTLERQTKAGEDAAKAAFLNAQAVIDAERPWFAVSIERTKPKFDFWRVRITNKGRAPGQLWELFAERIFVDTPESLPLPPRYSSPTFAPDTRFFANGDSFTVRETSIEDGFLPNEIWEQQSETKLDFLVIYGRVTYKDTFTGGRDNEVMHETRWCYLWQGSQDKFVPCGPAEYNGYQDYTDGRGPI